MWDGLGAGGLLAFLSRMSCLSCLSSSREHMIVLDRVCVFVCVSERESESERVRE